MSLGAFGTVIFRAGSALGPCRSGGFDWLVGVSQDRQAVQEMWPVDLRSWRGFNVFITCAMVSMPLSVLSRRYPLGV